MTEKRDLCSPETVIIQVGTNDLKTARNLDFVMEEVYYGREETPELQTCPDGVLRHRDVSWGRTGALDDRYNWVANALRLSFVDTNSCIEDGDFATDRLHLDGRGKRRLGQLYARVSGLDVEGSVGSKK